MMNSRVVAAVLAVAGVMSWAFPTFSGFAFEPANVSPGEGRIVGAIFLVGAALVWFLPRK